jgi:hypothetical protein
MVAVVNLTVIDELGRVKGGEAGEGNRKSRYQLGRRVLH